MNADKSRMGLRIIFLLASGMRLAGQESCGDLLAELHRKPRALEFLECKAHPELQTKPLTATYRVKGTDAAGVERYLARALGMRRLRRVCCIWESGNRSFRTKNGREYSLAMGSGETIVRSRAEWGRIPYLYVTFSQETEEP